MSGALESKDGSTAGGDQRPSGSDGVAERTERAQVEPLNALELRTITPEQIQILAATGC